MAFSFPTNQDPALARVTVVVVTYFSADCIKVISSALAACPNVVFVDNASTDDTLDNIASYLPHAQIIGLSKNIGFGAANNRGIEQSDTEFVALINPDVSFDVSVLTALIARADQWPEAFVIAPQLMGRSGRVDASYRWPRHLWDSKGSVADGPICTGFVTGAFMLARRSKLDVLKGFDESFFLYYEDEDLCQRAFDLGMAIIVDPQTKVTHFSRGSVMTSSNLKAEYFRAKHHTYSKFLFDFKHGNSRVSRQVKTSKLLRLWLLVLVALPLRLLIPSGKYQVYLGRVLGRIAGLYDLTINGLKTEVLTKRKNS
jgi:N-acetylglucosaminyl-diphospho-decaprenol L-rhamnosyltransferase